MKNINFKIIFHFLGALVAINGIFIGLCSGISFFLLDDIHTNSLAISAVINIFTGGAIFYFSKNHSKRFEKREGLLIVSLGWLMMSLFGSLPYLISGEIVGFTDAFFETISGYTTTGSSILNDIESVSSGILLWRSTTHWIGGMGIIVLTVAILPLIGVGGMQLFMAESPGPSADKLHPRIADTAKRLWYIYLFYTFAETILLKVAGMTWFDAINHAMSTLSTGGFSTKNTSVAYWNDTPLIQYIIIFFMFLAGINFVLSYYLIKGKWNKLFKNEEFKYYCAFVILFTVIISTVIYLVVDMQATDVEHAMIWGKLEASFRHALFQVLAIITTTGFATANYLSWTAFVVILIFSMFFIGGSAGSTSGGIKVVRQVIMLKNSFAEFTRQIHPNAIIPVRYNHRAVPQPIVYNILGFFIIYTLTFIVGSVLFAFTGLDLVSSFGASASSLGNVGPAFGELGPTSNYSILTPSAKWISSFLMLLGRLELFTVLALFTPAFWNKR